jgi:hypothetical protein
VGGTDEGDAHARVVLEISGRVKSNVYYYGSIRLGTRASLEGQIRRQSDNVHQLSRTGAAV